MLHSILDNDFYKFTMQNAVVKLFPYARTRYAFINRGEHAFPPGFGEALRVAVDNMVHLALTAEEKAFLELHCPFLDPTYRDFLSGFRFDPAEITIIQTGDALDVHLEGYWYRTILWEVPLMAMISELWYQLGGDQRDNDQVLHDNTQAKIEHYKRLGIRVAEFGTRRRHSYDVHDKVVATLKEQGRGCFIGTSNVHMAQRHGIKPIGTHAHEWFMFHAARFGFKMANILALENWVKVYRGDLGIALSDTFTSRAFFRSFDKKFAKLFDGVRHDSADPIEFAEATIRHYESLGIDPKTKTIVFSDGLDTDKVDRIVRYCAGRIGMSFGIGTNFTNDIGPQPMNMVIKMTEARPEGQDWVPVIKLSDVSSKHTGDPDMIRLAHQVLSLKELD